MGSQTRRTLDNNVEVRECMLCSKGNKSNPDNLWKLRIRSDGCFYCFRCSTGGGFSLLKKKLNILPSSISSVMSTTAMPTTPLRLSPETKQIDYQQILSLQDKYRRFSDKLFPLTSFLVGSGNDTSNLDVEVLNVRKYLFEVRQLQLDVLMKYGVGMTTQQFQDDENKWVDKVCITFPWMKLYDESSAADADIDVDLNINGNPSDSAGRYIIERVKCRALETKGLQRLLPRGGSWGFFGWHLVRNYHRELVITEGEYDAMAVAQALSDLDDNHPLKDTPVISLPNGCSSLPVDLLPQLERFKKVYLWLDNDKPGIENSEKIARKIGLARCYVVRPDASMSNPPKDANDALRQSIDGLIPSLLAEAKILSHHKLFSFSDMKNDVLRLIRSDRPIIGTATPSIPKLTSITKGFRKGELVILTGPTGTGKTTLLSQLSLDFAKQGMPTLWGSFEIKNDILLTKMLSQYSGANLRTSDPHKLDQIIQDFEVLPLKFMNFHGGSDVEQILEVMTHAIYQDDISHVILDNLQFMTPRATNTNSPYSSQFQRFDIQDFMLDKFRKFATEKKVNVIVVIHPRKEDEDTFLSLASISGTSKATQEADVVLILQKVKNEMYLDVKKNRYDGQLGRIPLGFANFRTSYYEKDPPSSAE